jgi:hypothetical protein
MTIGNVPKDICRKPSCSAQMLIGYIPTSKLEGITNKAAHRRVLANMFHSCMGKVLNPICSYGETGLVMMSRDGTWRRCHPIFATFVGDYPEQTLVMCTFNGCCPKCLVPPDQLGEYNHFPPRDHAEAIDTYLLADEDIGSFHTACHSAGLKPVYHPFWHSLPLTDIFLSITPNVLHQILQVSRPSGALVTRHELFPRFPSQISMCVRCYSTTNKTSMWLLTKKETKAVFRRERKGGAHRGLAKRGVIHW